MVQPARRDVTIGEYRKLQGILVRLPDFQETRDRRVLVETAGLKEFATTFDFEGKPGTVAWELITDLQGRLKELLLRVSDLDDLKSKDKEFIGDLLKTCSFD